MTQPPAPESSVVADSLGSVTQDQNSPKENEPETWEWYSVCSMHREAVPDCSMCKAGTWVKNSEQALSEAFFAAAPEAWVAFMNREPTL